jgi:peptide/nickel transport system permease protein
MLNKPSERINKAQKHSKPIEALIRLVKEKPMGAIGGVITLLLLLTGIFATYLAPYPVNQTNVPIALSAPSASHWLGTDNLGRDLLSRIIFGARISVIVGLAASLISTLVSTLLGILCGYWGGLFDLITQRFVDAFMCFPGLILLMVLMSIIGQGMFSIIIVLGISGGIVGSRVVRSAVIAIKENMYFGAAVAIGCPTSRVLLRHVLPGIMAPLIIMFSMSVPGVILTEAGLSFLGFGIPPPAPSWGGMLSGSARTYMFLAPWMAIFPGLALAIVVYGVNMFGDALRDILDPRLRGGVGRYVLKVKKIATTKSKPTAPAKSFQKE